MYKNDVNEGKKYFGVYREEVDQFGLNCHIISLKLKSSRATFLVRRKQDSRFECI